MKDTVLESKNSKHNFNFFVGVLRDSLICFIFAIATFLFLLNSPSHIWNNSEITTDSSVFQTIAFQMKNGAVPYRDTFDHKGPLTYLINYIAYSINPHNGLFYIEFIVVFAVFLLSYLIARLKCNNFFSIVAAFITFSPLFTFFQGGNYTEEYALPFILGALYIFLDYFLNNKITKCRLILCGLSFGAVLMIRANLISVWIVFCVAVLIECLERKNFKDLKTFIIFFAIGLSLVVLPFIIWLCMNSALSDFWNDYVLFNIKYTNENPLLKMFTSENKKYSFFHFYNNTLLIVSTVILIYDLKCKKSFLNLYCLAYLLLDLLLSSMSGLIYGHYGIILVASIVYPISILFNLCQELEKNNKANEAVSLIILIYFIATLVAPDWFKLIQTAPYEKNSDEIKTSTEAKEIKSIVRMYSSTDDKITVWGNWNFLYLYTCRLPASKYSYQYPIALVDPSIYDDYFEDLEKNIPKIIVVQSGYSQDLITNFADKHDYELVYPSENSSDGNCLVYVQK